LKDHPTLKEKGKLNMELQKSKFLFFGILVLIASLVFGSLGTGGVNAQSANLLTNPGFESGASQTPTGWTESGTTAASKSDSGSAHSGTYKGTFWRTSSYTVGIHQTKTGLTNGTYTLSAWVKSGGSQTTARMEAKNCGGTQQNYTLPTTSTWTQITISNISVTNNQCTVGFYSVAAANQWINFDDVQFTLNSSSATSTPTRTPTITPTPIASGLNMRGADVSSLQRALDLGQKYYNASGVEQNPLDILQSIGVNYVRLRVWVNPVSGYNNMDKVVAFAPQVKSRGMKLLIDLHYSDSWADPGKQYKPAAWNGHTLAQLKTDVYNHTYNVCTALKNAGATPDMIQVGNEITPGLLWEEGRISNNNFANAAALVKEGYNAVKACNSSTLVMLHTDRGGSNADARWWYDGMQAQGVSWDVTGLSYYCYWHGTIPAMQSNVSDIKSRYSKPVVIVETSYTFTTGSGDSFTNVITAATPCAGYPASATGQVNFFNDVKTAIKNAGGEGVFWWEPTWVGTAGNGWDPTNINGTGSEWDNQAVFDFSFKLLPNINWWNP
jgi:arabinogalactan endo-1,4-beta-galactosidase